jgi:hypothetical protein
MVIHLQGAQPFTAVCGNPAPGDPVPLNEALTGEGRYFDCVDCHRALTGGLSHSGPQDDTR